MGFDPAAPLPGAPDPWAASEMPAPRDGPPYVMTEMISAEPELAGRIVRRLAWDPALHQLAGLVLGAVRDGLPVTVTGCGTSEHAALVLAALLEDGVASSGRPSHGIRTIQAFELAGREPGEAVIAVSHEGGTAATIGALEHAGGRRGPTALVTVSDRSPGAAQASVVLTTGEQDQSWCHTVGYLSPIVAAACLRAAISGTQLEAQEATDQLAAGQDDASAEALAAALAGVERFLVVGSGIDYPAARELALKIEEGVRLPATAHHLETIRHGHWAAATARTGLVLLLTDGDGRGVDLRDRAASVIRAGTALGMPSVVIGSTDVTAVADSATAGRHLVDLSDALPRRVAAALAVVTPLQLFAERLARVRGTNPDTLGRDDPRQEAAGAA
jgi:glucosamine 6-phosphate synthetase-like amidotransferase/phosphosugar isomerase protein